MAATLALCVVFPSQIRRCRIAGLILSSCSRRFVMVRRLVLAVAMAALVVLGLRAAVADRPVRLARHPDYHAGKVAFSYLGDIWTANEDGTNIHRLTDNLAREDFPHFSPDGRSIAFSSNRYGNYDVFVVPAAGGTPHRLTYHT